MDSQTAHSLVGAAAERLLTDLADPRSSHVASSSWRRALWDGLTENGLTLSWVPERCGGSGGELADGFAIARAAGSFALPVPLVETMLAGWLLSLGDMASPRGAMSVLPAHPGDSIVLHVDGTLSGRVRSIPYAGEVEHFAVVFGGEGEGEGSVGIGLISASDSRCGEGVNLAGDRQGSVFLERVRPIATAKAPEGFGLTQLMLMGCTLRSLQIAGALQYMLDLSVQYATERVAFGKPIAKFQAIQHHLARLAAESAAATAVAASAADALASSSCWREPEFLEATAAKVRCCEAAGKACAIAHQVHGAIGFTEEYVLQRFTLRALGWRDDFGSESHWSVALGEMISAKGASALWPLIASR